MPGPPPDGEKASKDVKFDDNLFRRFYVAYYFQVLYYYAVPDFIDLHLGNYHWFIFNVADIFITVGIISFIFIELLKKEKISTSV